MFSLKRLSDGVELPVSAYPQWVAGTWECGDQRFLDQGKGLYESAGIGPCPVIDGPTLFMLFTPAEEAGIRASADVQVQVLVRRADDPRVTKIDLSQPSVQQLVTYLSTTSPPLIQPARVAQILTGQPQ